MVVEPKVDHHHVSYVSSSASVGSDLLVDIWDPIGDLLFFPIDCGPGGSERVSFSVSYDILYLKVLFAPRRNDFI